MDASAIPLPASEIDPLTGLGSRHALLSHLGHALADPARQSPQVALLFIDVDGMYRFNKENGRDSGDEALRIFARRLRGIARSEDRVFRLGGDEFAIIHQGTEVRQEAVSLAERILREAQAELGTTEPTERASHGGGMRLACTIGIAISTSGSTVDQLMSEADWAMFFGKAKYGVRFGSGEPCKSGDQYVVFNDLRPEQIGSHMSPDT